MSFKLFVSILKETAFGKKTFEEKTFENDFSKSPPTLVESQGKATWTNDDPRAALFDNFGPALLQRMQIEQLQKTRDSYMPRPLVSLELFFEGNDDFTSILPDRPDKPVPSEVYAFLKGLRNKEDVHDILIEVREMENPDGWPFSDTIWFITTAGPNEVVSWFPDRLSPDEVIEGFKGLYYPLRPYVIRQGYQAVAVWYDVT